MSKKAWIIGGVAVVAVIGATTYREAGSSKEEKQLRLLKP